MDKKTHELNVQNKAVKLGTMGILILTTAFYISEIVLLDCHNYGWYAILAIYCTLLYGYKGIKLPKTQYVFISLIWLITTIVCVINYITHRF